MTITLSNAAEKAFATFRNRFYYAETPAPFAKYDTLENKTLLHILGSKKLAPGSDALSDFWELSFQAAIRFGYLKPIVGWEMPVAEADFRALDEMPAAEFKERLNDPAFQDLIARADRQRAKRGPYETMTATQYKSMDPLVRQRKLTYDDGSGFGAAVQRLIDAGDL